MQTSRYQSIKKELKKTQLVDDFLVVEAPLEIQINEKPFAAVMRTPGDDEVLLRGLLYAEDIYKGKAPLRLKNNQTKPNGFAKVQVQISEKELRKGYLNKRTLLSVSSCGICGKQELDSTETPKKKLKNTPALSMDLLPSMFENMRSKQATFDQTGGSHAAALFDKKHSLLNTKEDIGRHNAVDKCIGDLLQKEQLHKAAFLLVSGRVSYEIISKAFFAKIGTVVAVSACSSLAVDFAKEFGICLIGFSRQGKSTVYAHPNRTQKTA